MTSTPTTRNRLEKQGLGENLNTWGNHLNLYALDLIDSALDGVTTISSTGAVTLTSVNYAADQSRMRVLNFTGAASSTVTIPSLEKYYIVRAALADVIVTTGAATTATVKAGNTSVVWCDGSAVRKGQDADFAGVVLTSIGTPVAATDAANKLYVDNAAWEQDAGILPGQTGNAGKYLITDGTTPSWSLVLPLQTGNAGKVLITDGTTTSWALLLPTQTSQAGKYLTTDGTVTSWALVLPSQTSNAGKVLSTDGTTASWALALPSQTGAAGKILKTNGTVTAWDFDIKPLTIKTAAYTAVAGDVICADTITVGAFSVTLPAACTVGDPPVVIFDGAANTTLNGFATNNLTVLRNGNLINGEANDVFFATKGVSVTFEPTSTGWRLYNGR